jgi:hypothetical protein
VRRLQSPRALPTVATANEIKEMFLSYEAAGVSFHQALKREPWGARTFIVSDPDENLASLLARQLRQLMASEKFERSLMTKACRPHNLGNQK